MSEIFDGLADGDRCCIVFASVEGGNWRDPRITVSIHDGTVLSRQSSLFRRAEDGFVDRVYAGVMSCHATVQEGHLAVAATLRRVAAACEAKAAEHDRLAVTAGVGQAVPA